MTKYSAIKTVCAAGHTHDSKLEAKRCDQLVQMEADGKIHRLEQQPEFRIEINGVKVFTYVADFAWFQSDCRVVEDCKGYRTDVYRLKKKIVEAVHRGVVITEFPPRIRKKRKAPVKRKAA